MGCNFQVAEEVPAGHAAGQSTYRDTDAVQFVAKGTIGIVKGYHFDQRVRMLAVNEDAERLCMSWPGCLCC